jgi:hypothetical protein
MGRGDYLNILLIEKYRSEYDSVELVRYEGKSKYLDCYKYYYYKDKLDMQKIIDNVKFGNLRFEDDRVVVCVRIKN